jgi:hypothetical protein
METAGKRNIPDTLANIFSFIFHPLLIPLYGLIIIFSAPTMFGYLPFNVKKLLLLIVLVDNIFLPVSLLPFFIHRNIISSWIISDRKERIIPLIMTTALYAATSFIIFRFPLPLFLKSLIYSAFFLSLVVTLINLRWNISIHSVGAGALIAMVLILSVRMHTPLTEYLISSIIAAGLLLSSRLRLNYHNPAQVWSGLFVGLLGLSLFMIIVN